MNINDENRRMMPQLKTRKRALIKIERHIEKAESNKTEVANSLKKRLLSLDFKHLNPQNIEDDLFIYKSEKYADKRSVILIFFNHSKICIVVKEEIPVDQMIFKAENNYRQEEIPIIIKNIQLLQKVLNG